MSHELTAINIHANEFQVFFNQIDDKCKVLCDLAEEVIGDYKNG